MLLVVAATEPELRGVAGRTDGERVDVLVCGVGPVDAAARVARRLAGAPAVSAVLHVGIAGCRAGAGIAIGELVLGTGAVYCDTASTLVEQRAEPDAAVFARVREALPSGVREAVIGTSADVGGTSADGVVDVEAMEGFAVLRAAALAGVPAVEVRAIANEVAEPDRALWRFDVALAALEHALPGLVKALAR